MIRLACVLVLLVVNIPLVCAQVPGTVYSENFASGGPGWSSGTLISSSPNSWKLGVPSIGYLPPYPQYSWGTARNPLGAGTNSLTGGYYAREYSFVKSPYIDLSQHGIGYAVQLQWDDYFNIHSGSGSVEVSNNYGMTWIEAYRGSGDQTVTGSWRMNMTKTLAPAFDTAGFRVRFRVDTYAQAYTAWQGFYFDNVRVGLATPTGNYDVANAWLDDWDSFDYPGPVPSRTDLTAVTYDDNHVTLSIPANTTAFKGGAEYVGDLYGPWYDNDYYPDDFGIPNASAIDDFVAYGVGDEYETVSFSNPVRLQFNGQAGKTVGWSDLEHYHPIDTPLADDDGSLLEGLGVDAAYLAVGNDLVVWTNHMSYFVMFVPEPTALVLLAVGTCLLPRQRKS